MTTVVESMLIANNWITFILGVVCNVLVMYFAFKVKNAEIMKNRWNFTSQAAFQLVECLNLTFIQLGLHQSGAQVTLILLGYVTSLDISYSYIFYCFFMYLFPLRIFVLPVGFVHRYSLICGKHRLASMFHARCLICTGVLLSVVPLALGLATKVIIHCTRKNLESPIFQLLGEVVLVRFKPEFVWLLGLICSIMCATSAFAYGIVFVTSARILKTLRDSVTAQKTKELQRELTIVMLLQAFMPLICTTLPILTFCTVYFGKLPVSDYGSLIIALVNWQPCVNPILSLYFVKPFKRQLLHTIRPSTPLSTTEMRTVAKKTIPTRSAAVTMCRSESPSDLFGSWRDGQQRTGYNLQVCRGFKTHCTEKSLAA